jgi:hypothetical protein
MLMFGGHERADPRPRLGRIQLGQLSNDKQGNLPRKPHKKNLSGQRENQWLMKTDSLRCETGLRVDWLEKKQERLRKLPPRQAPLRPFESLCNGAQTHTEMRSPSQASKAE